MSKLEKYKTHIRAGSNTERNKHLIGASSLKQDLYVHGTQHTYRILNQQIKERNLHKNKSNDSGRMPHQLSNERIESEFNKELASTLDGWNVIPEINKENED